MTPRTRRPIPEKLDRFRRLKVEGEVRLRGASMEPAIPAGTTVRLRGGTGVPDVGDVVGYWDGNKVVVHRVREVTSKDGRVWFQAQGDANSRPDDWLAADDLVGRVIQFPPGRTLLGRLAVASRRALKGLRRRFRRRESSLARGYGAKERQDGLEG